MLQPLREQFNADFTTAQYDDLLYRLNHCTRTSIEFRVAETPCFFPQSLLDELAETGAILTRQLLDDRAYIEASNETIPPRFRVPNENPQPNFMTVDFGLVRNPDGSLAPRLVEMQAFPSVFGYQDMLARQYIETYRLGSGLHTHLGGLSSETYWQLLRDVIVRDHDPENV